ncbi:MAG: fatty acid desaturase [Bacillaceae bacterium]
MSKQKQMALRKQMAPYEKAEIWRSIRQMMNTILPFFAMWFFAYKSLEISYFLTLAFATVAALLLTRIFIIFHDCCHYSFFKNRKANRIVGTITGILTMFPYNQWQHDHAIHHATSGNLDKRGVGDIWMLTVDEYIALSSFDKLKYRLYRNPIVMFGLGPIYKFLITNRFNDKDANRKERMNTYITNVGIVAMVGLGCYLVGWQAFLLVHGPIFFIAGVAGIWLFYVQHTFEDAYFEEDKDWEYVKAAVEGSSFYKLPKVLQWLTGNIGYHHVHHLSPRVPNYKLEQAHNQTEPLHHVPTITLGTSLTSLKFRLWDEQQKKFISFRELNKRKEVQNRRVGEGMVK